MRNNREPLLLSHFFIENVFNQQVKKRFLRKPRINVFGVLTAAGYGFESMAVAANALREKPELLARINVDENLLGDANPKEVLDAAMSPALNPWLAGFETRNPDDSLGIYVLKRGCSWFLNEDALSARGMAAMSRQWPVDVGRARAHVIAHSGLGVGLAHPDELVSVVTATYSPAETYEQKQAEVLDDVARYVHSLRPELVHLL